MNNVAYNDSKSVRLMEGWKTRISKLEAATGKKSSLERRLSLAYALNNTKKARDYHEAIQTPDAGLYKIFALDIVGAVVQNLIAPEIVSMQPMDNTIGQVLYLEYQYGTTKGATKAGDVFADTRNFYKSDSTYSSNQVVNEPVALTAGTGADEGKYVAQLGVMEETINGVATGLRQFQASPINPTTVSLTFTHEGQELVVTDDGAGALVDATNVISGTINYVTGKLVVGFTGMTPAEGDTVTADYSYAITYVDAGASSIRIPEIQLKMKKIPIIAQPRRLKALWSFESQYILSKEYGGANIEEIMNATVAGEIMHEIDSEVMTDLYRVAGAGPEQTWSSAVPRGISMTDHYNTFKIAVDKCCAKIYKATRRVRGNWLVGGVNVGTVCSSVVGFKAEDVADVNGPCFFGTLPNGVKVYLNPDFDDDVFVVGYKGRNDMFDTGYILGMYMPVMTIPMVQLEDMAGRKGWAAMYGKVTVNNRMYIRGRIVNN